MCDISTCRGLAGRLASAEDSLACLIGGARGDRVDNRWIMLSRKREKLEAQLAEAIWIKNAIERKTPKVRILRTDNFVHNPLHRSSPVC